MKKLIVANWKMQLSYQASLALARSFVKEIKNPKSEAVICPDHLSLPAVAKIIKKTKFYLGAQDSAGAPRGAYTGEVSPLDLKALGVKYVIIGHSERREHLHENAAIINAKILSALAVKLTPILCVGEKLTERLSGQTKNYLSDELRRALKNVKLKTAADLIIAYEPVWAISTNKNAKPLAAAEATAIQKFIKIRAAKILHKNIRVLYGGSVNAQNAGRFLAEKNIDGLLVGGASLKVKEFKSLC
jgi:triosephosphate isomerase